jgi:GNAT superfamily N-acetyltransferase
MPRVWLEKNPSSSHETRRISKAIILWIADRLACETAVIMPGSRVEFSALLPAGTMRNKDQEQTRMNTEPIIRQATQQDTQAVQACVIAAFEKYIERLGRPPAPLLQDFPAAIEAGRVWVAEVEGQLVGSLIQYETEMGFYLDTVAVHSVYQGSGVGRALLQFAEREALRRGYNSIYLCTHATMTENRQLYPKIGYVEFEYQDGSGYDRVYFRKPLARTKPGCSCSLQLANLLNQQGR